MSDERNIGRNKEGAPKRLSSPADLAFDATGYGLAQEYLARALKKTQTKIETFPAEKARLEAEIKAYKEIIRTEEPKIYHQPSSGTITNTPEYVAAELKLASLQTELEDLLEPVPLPSVQTLEKLHELATKADASFADKSIYRDDLGRFNELSPELQQYYFPDLAKSYRADFIANAEKHWQDKKIQAEMIDAVKCYSGEDQEKSLADLDADKYEISDIFGKPKPQESDYKNVYDGDALDALGYVPPKIGTPEFNSYLNRRSSDMQADILDSIHAVRFNIDLARGVYPQLNLSETYIEHQRDYLAKWDAIEGAGLGLASLASGEIAVKGIAGIATKIAGTQAVKGAYAATALWGGEAIAVAAETGLGRFVVGASSKVSKFTGVGTNLGLSFGAQIAIDEGVLMPLTVKDSQGAALAISGLEIPPLSSAEQREMNEKIMSKDSNMLKDIALMMSFNQNSILDYPELTIPAGTPIPSRCESLDVKPDSKDAQGLVARSEVIGKILDNYERRSKEFDRVLKEEIDKLPPLETQPLSPMEIRQNNANSVAINGNADTLKGR